LRVKYWEIIADNLSKLVGAWLWIAKREPSELLTRMATESVSLCARMKS
jgi:hypothetical protein